MLPPFLFTLVMVFFLGATAGYLAGTWRSVGEISLERPKIFGAGTELLDRPRDSQGVPFNLTSTFAFTESMFHCAVASNDKAFSLRTYSLGTVVLPEKQFSMSIDSAGIEKVAKTGRGRVEIRGTARSITRIGERYEDAIVPFLAVAADGGPSYEKDSLVLTIYYNEKDSPMQFAIFGPEPRFGQPVTILSGDISILD